jgi:hypothetical protein
MVLPSVSKVISMADVDEVAIVVEVAAAMEEETAAVMEVMVEDVVAAMANEFISHIDNNTIM